MKLFVDEKLLLSFPFSFLSVRKDLTAIREEKYLSNEPILCCVLKFKNTRDYVFMSVNIRDRDGKSVGICKIYTFGGKRFENTS